MEMSKKNSNTVTELSEFSTGSVQVQKELKVKTNPHFGFWWDGALTFSHNSSEQLDPPSHKLGGHWSHHNKMFQR